MKRKTLDAFFVVGGFALAVLLLVLGLVLNSNASFARDYVRDQLSQQKISFTPADRLDDEEKQADCLVKYAGKTLSSGKQSECYANEYIALHMGNSATEAGYEGATYASLGTPQRELRTKVADMTKANADDPKIAEEQKKLDGVNSLRDTMFRGETLRGLLLTTYGFSVFGDKASQAATVAFLAAAVLVLASIAGVIHRLRTPDAVTVS